MPTSKVIIKYGIVCDEVRREDNGKLFLIGVYGDGILPHSFPATLAPWVVLNIVTAETVKTPLEFKVTLDGQQLAKGSGEFEAARPGISLTTVPAILLQGITGPGTLAFDFRFGDGEWQTVVEMPIRDRQPSVFD